MLNTILRKGTAIGVILSILGYLLINTISTSEAFESFYDSLYKLTLIFSVLYLVTISEFINQKFSIIIRILGLMFLVLFVLNLGSELFVYKFDDIDMVAFLLFTSIYFFYLKFFMRKQEKSILDYLRVVFLALLLVNGFLILIGFHFMIPEPITKIVFWVILLAHLKTEYTNMYLKYVA